MNIIISPFHLPGGVATSEMIMKMLVMRVVAICQQLQNIRWYIQTFTCIFFNQNNPLRELLFEISRPQMRSWELERWGKSVLWPQNLCSEWLFCFPHPFSKWYTCHKPHLAPSEHTDLLGPPWVFFSSPLNLKKKKIPVSYLPVTAHLSLWDPVQTARPWSNPLACLSSHLIYAFPPPPKIVNILCVVVFFI